MRMMTNESNQVDGDEIEEGTHDCAHCDKNCLMKALMRHADKHVKQETRTSSMKRNRVAIDGKTKEEEGRRKGSFLEK